MNLHAFATKKCTKSIQKRPSMDLQVDSDPSVGIHMDIIKTSPRSLKPDFNRLEEPVGSANSSHHRRSLRCRCCNSPLFLGGVPAVKREQ